MKKLFLFLMFFAFANANDDGLIFDLFQAQKIYKQDLEKDCKNKNYKKCKELAKNYEKGSNGFPKDKKKAKHYYDLAKAFKELKI